MKTDRKLEDIFVYFFFYQMKLRQQVIIEFDSIFIFGRSNTAILVSIKRTY